MTILAKNHVPGLYVEDHSITVPLDWAAKTPGEGFDGQRLNLFYRVLCAPGREHDDLPLLVFLQGGPGGSGPRPLSRKQIAWIDHALNHFRLVLPDQRGTGRSSCIDSHCMARLRSGHEQAAYLKHFLADSIVRDLEHLRLSDFGGEQWVTLGQSYGGFLSLTYLSLFPEAIQAAFIAGGVPDITGSAQEVYQHTVPRMLSKTRHYYERYPQDVQRVGAVADYLQGHMVLLPNGDALSIQRLQTLGADFGRKPGFERVHWIFDHAFTSGPGLAGNDFCLSDDFLEGTMIASASTPLYWPLQEFIYANGELNQPTNWAAQRVRDTFEEFTTDSRPLMFTGGGGIPVDVPGREGPASFQRCG